MIRTYLGFDFGRRYIGVAVGRSPGARAQALATVAARDGRPDWIQVDRVVRDWQPQALVVGLPVHMDGQPQPLTQAARRFGNQLQARYNVPLHWADERLTTWSAHQDLTERGIPGRRHKPQLDARAAEMLLQAFLDSLEGLPGAASGD